MINNNRYNKYVDIGCHTYLLEYWKDNGMIVGRLIDVPGIMSQGLTMPLLKANIIDAYNLMMKGR